jgi:DUF4097 and DUF4098 domain-containing protein YvlB
MSNRGDVATADRPLRISTHSGSVTVIGEDRIDVVVDEPGADIASTSDGVEVVGRSTPITVRAPTGTEVFVGTASGSVALRGRLGDVHVTTRSGRIDAEHVHSADARSRSGNIAVERCEDLCRCCSRSGDVRVGQAHTVDLMTASGSVDAETVDTATVRAGSGEVRLGVAEVDAVDVDAHSGSVEITIPAGVRPAVDLLAGSGSVRCDCTPGDHGSLRVRTRSGDVSVIER